MKTKRELKEERVFEEAMGSIKSGKAKLSFDMDGLSSFIKEIKDERNAEVKQAIDNKIQSVKDWLPEEHTNSMKNMVDWMVSEMGELLKELGLDAEDSVSAPEVKE